VVTALVNLTLGPCLKATHAVAALRAIGGVQVLLAHVHKGTLVIQVRQPLHAAAAYEVARRLGVGAVRQEDHGEVDAFGPAAHAWMNAPMVALDGRRLAA
jgi:hypothetical protein